MPPKRSLIVLSAAVALLYAFWTLRSGIQLAVDTPTYSHWADLLIGVRFNVAAYLHQQQFVAPPVTYLAWVMVVAIFKALLGPSWMTGVVLLNLASFSLGLYATLGAVRVSTRAGASVLLAATLFLFTSDLLIFVPYVLSDLMFWGLSTGVLGAAVAIASREDLARPPITRLAVAGSAAVLLALTVRPVALPLLLTWMAALVAAIMPDLLSARARAAGIAVAAAIAAVVIVHALLLQHPGSWPLGAEPAMIGMVRAEYGAGVVVHQASPPITTVPPASLAGFVRITLEKLLFFLTPWLPYYSVSHQVMNLAFFVPAYGLWITALRTFARLSPAQQRVTWLLSFYVIVVSAFHAMTLIDSDHRYRLPVLPALIMLAAIGLESARRPQRLASTGRTR